MPKVQTSLSFRNFIPKPLGSNIGSQKQLKDLLELQALTWPCVWTLPWPCLLPLFQPLFFLGGILLLIVSRLSSVTLSLEESLGLP